MTVMANNETRGTVVLLHGLARGAGSMSKMERALQLAGYTTCNIGYPSRQYPVESLARDYVLPEIHRCTESGGDASNAVHFVTHSMGGILLRYLAAEKLLTNIGRSVMLGPPNHGSEVVDTLGDWWAFSALNGPAGQQLGTHSLPDALGPANFQVGVVAGNKTISPLLSRLLPDADDGKVSVASTRLEGMQDFIIMPVTHTFMMRNREVINQVMSFLASGKFKPN